MSSIIKSIELLEEPDKSIGKILIEFYETMKKLETDENRGGMQAAKIIMTISDLTKKLNDPTP